MIDVKMLEQAEREVGVNFGEELTEYLLKYGYLKDYVVDYFGEIRCYEEKKQLIVVLPDT